MAQGDLEAVLAIERTTLTPWSREMVEAELRYAAGIRLVAEDGQAGGSIVGWCAARLVAPEAELLKIAVAKERRRQGIGAALLGHLCRALHDVGICELFLEVRGRNHPALSLYGRFGFTEIGRRPAYYSEPEDDALLLRRHLQPGSTNTLSSWGIP